MELNDQIISIKGIGEKTASLFAKASVFCVKDLLLYTPRNYINLPDIRLINELKTGTINAVNGVITSNISIIRMGNKTRLSFDLSDNSGTIKVYYYNALYLKKSLYKGMNICIYGYIAPDKNVFFNPKITNRDDYIILSGTLNPSYPLVKGLTNNKITDIVKKVLSNIDKLEDYLPDSMLEKYKLMSMNEAIKKIHCPVNMEEVFDARRRLAFNEFFSFFYAMFKLNGKKEKEKSNIILEYSKNIDEFINKLPYSLTKGQTDSFKEISKDLSSGYIMNRLLQGDVGSGKTIIAMLASYQAILNNYQSAIMAPTVVLASQHYEDALKYDNLYNLGLCPVLLTGSMKAKERKEALAKIKNGEAKLIIGTHALFSEGVDYYNLGLTICDEQHRFGVKQRLSLINKGMKVHQLVMSATPIPRTLALILYGDLDISTIKEKPSNRLPLKNAVVGPEYRKKNYEFIGKEIAAGRQAYIICPMVEEGELEGLKNVESYIDEIKPYFEPSVKMAILHGKMKEDVKDNIMMDYKNHNIDLLISTTVIEVGVNVPNATVMMIENSERFGLSQLHQLRGRVGRGEYQSYAIFVTENKSDHNMERLSLLSKTNDGFEIASEDLKLRGPGDFFGYRQSGNPMFKIADIYADSDLLKDAKDAFDIFENNVELISKLDRFENYIYSFDKGYMCL